MGAVLQQRVQGSWQPLAFFAQKLSLVQQKYNMYDRDLLAIYEAVKYSCHMLEARNFTVLTDHKPLTFTFHQKRDKCSPCQFNHLDFISQFTTDICHISGQENVAADTLSRVKDITVCIHKRQNFGVNLYIIFISFFVARHCIILCNRLASVCSVTRLVMMS